jgi:hypothetical protein
MMAYDDVDMAEMEGAISDTAITEDSTNDEGVEATETQTQAAPSQQQSQQQVPEQTWDGTQWNLKYRGQPYTPKSRDELVNLAQKGFSYNQAMEQINRREKEYNDQIASLRTQYSHYDEFDKALRNNPALAERIMQVAQEFQGQQSLGQQQPGVDHRVYSELTTRLQQLEAQYQERTNSEYDNKLRETLNKIRTENPNVDWDFDDGTGNMEKKLIQFAYDNGIYNLDYAYRAMMWDSNNVNAKADALKSAAASKQQASRAGVINKSTTAGNIPTKKGYKYGDTYSDLARRMTEEIKT